MTYPHTVGTLTLFIPGVPSNTNRSGHFGSGKWQTVGERKKFRALTAEIAKEQAELQHWTPSNFTIISAYHCSPVKRRRDPLGLAERLKSIMDGLVDAEIIPDDDELHIQVNLRASIKADTAGIALVLRAMTHEEEGNE